METLDIKIALDPVNDGAVLKETKLKRKDEGALIIATNGESRIVDAYEAQEILNKLNDIGHRNQRRLRLSPKNWRGPFSYARIP